MTERPFLNDVECEALLEMHARINVIHDIQAQYLILGCPPVSEVRTSSNALAAANMLRRERKRLSEGLSHDQG